MPLPLANWAVFCKAVTRFTHPRAARGIVRQGLLLFLPLFPSLGGVARSAGVVALIPLRWRGAAAGGGVVVLDLDLDSFNFTGIFVSPFRLAGGALLFLRRQKE